MKAVVFEQFSAPPSIQQVPDPAPAPHGVVVKVMANGVCRSDWHGWMGHDPDIRLPHVPGHELSGVVEAVGKDVVVQWRRWTVRAANRTCDRGRYVGRGAWSVMRMACHG